MVAFAAFTFDRNAIQSVTKQRFLFVIVPDCWSCFYRPLWGPYPLLTGFYRVLPGFLWRTEVKKTLKDSDRGGLAFHSFFFSRLAFVLGGHYGAIFQQFLVGFHDQVVVGGSIVDSVVTLYEDSIQVGLSTNRDALVRPIIDPHRFCCCFFFVSFSAAIRNRQSSDKSFDFITAAAAIARKLRAAPWARSPCLAPIFFCFCFFRSFSFGRFSVAIFLLWSVFVAVITATERPSITTKLLKQRALKMRLRPSYRTLRKWGLQCGRRHFDLIGRWNRSWKSSVFSFQTIIRDRRTIPSLFFVHF